MQENADINSVEKYAPHSQREVIIERLIDRLSSKVDTHKITDHRKEELSRKAKKVVSKSPKDADIYWSEVCDITSDFYERMYLFARLQMDELNSSPKEILQRYLDDIRHKRTNHVLNQDNKLKSKILSTFDEFITPADIVTLVKDPVRDVCDPERYRVKTPNCVQVSTVFSQIFKELGVNAVPVNYSFDSLIPHVGIFLKEEGALLRFDKGQSDHGVNITVVTKNSGEVLERWLKSRG